MKFLVSALFTSLASFACFAQDSAAYREFGDKANTPAEMTACTSDDAARVERNIPGATCKCCELPRRSFVFCGVVSRLRVMDAALVGIFLCMVEPFGASGV
jgi:hypothetical protein